MTAKDLFITDLRQLEDFISMHRNREQYFDRIVERAMGK